MTEEEVEKLAKHWFSQSNQPPFSWEGNAAFIRYLWRDEVRREYKEDPIGIRKQLDELSRRGETG